MPGVTWEGVDDASLAELASGGDRDAFGGLYERHFEGLYDFAYRIAGPASAADVVQDTFVKAWDALRGGSRPASVRPWLFGVARNTAIDEVRRTGRSIPTAVEEGDADKGPSVLARLEADPREDPEVVAQKRELVDLVWGAASALGPREHSLLDMHLRKGLSADELAETLGLSKGAVYTQLSRLRDSLEEAVVAMLLTRRRRDCEKLDTIVSGHRTDGAPTVALRRAIQAHIKECDTCSRTAKAVVAPSAIFSGLLVIPASPTLRRTIWDKVSARTAAPGSGGSTAEPAAEGPTPPPSGSVVIAASRRSLRIFRRPWLAAVAAVAVVAAASGVTFAIASGARHRSAGAAAGGRRPTPAAPVSSTAPLTDRGRSRVVFVASLDGQRVCGMPVGDLYMLEAGVVRRMTDLSKQTTGHGACPLSYRQPAWSPDGTELLALRREGSTTGLVVIKPDGTIVHDYTPSGESHVVTAAWAPDGRAIAASGSDRQGIVEILYADGTPAREVHADGFVASVSWSPDGTRLALSQPSRIVIVDRNGSVSGTLKTPGPTWTALAWSPGGSTIAIAGPSGVAVIDVDGGATRIAEGLPNTEPSCSWTSDGRMLVFSVGERGSSAVDIYAVNADGSGLLRLTRGLSGLGDYDPSATGVGPILPSANETQSTKGPPLPQSG